MFVKQSARKSFVSCCVQVPFLVVAAFLSQPSPAQNLVMVPSIRTVAGTGVAGYSGDGGQATKALLNNPLSSVIDALGNIYVADYANARVRVINPSTGIITTVAGNGQGGLSGSGGPATSAMLSGPGGLALDASGNLFIGDSYNNRVRVVNATTGIITTYAGSPGGARYSGDGGVATSAGFNYTDGISLDRTGNLYIADRSNFRIRRVDAVTKIVTTVVGTGVQGYSGDGGLAINAQIGSVWSGATDPHGNLFFSDPENHRIRRVDAATGIITTIAGNGTGGFSGDGGPATSAQLQLGTGASLDVDTAGNVYLTDNNNCRIREIVAATGIIQTIAGSTCGYAGDGGPVLSASLLAPQRVHYDSKTRTFVIGDTGNNAVRVFSTGLAIFPATAVGAASTTQDIYLQTTAPITIASISVPTSIDGKQEFTLGPITGCTVDGRTTIPAGTTCVVPVTFTPGFAGQRTLSLTAVTNTGTATFPLTGLATGSQVTLSPGPISTIAGTGNPASTGDIGPATSASLNKPEKTFVDFQGNVYIADAAANVVRKITAGTGVITTVAGNGTACVSATSACGDGGAATAANLNGASGVTVDPSGNIYIADRGDNRIRVVQANTGIITTYAGTGAASYTGDTNLATAATLNGPAAVATDQYGNVYIADTGNNVVREIDASTGVITTLVGTGTACSSPSATCGDGAQTTAANLNAPLGLAVDALRNVYIADTGDNRIRVVSSTTGLISTVAGSGSAGFSGDGGAASNATLNAPADVTFDAAQDLYIADAGNAVVRLVTKGDGRIRTIAGDTNTCAPTTSSCGDTGLATSAALNGPQGVSLDSDDDLYIADTGDSRIRKVNAKTATFNFASTALGSTSTDSPQTLNLFSTGTSALTLPVTGSNNPAISSHFTVGNTSTCPELTAGSGTAATLTSGMSCKYLLSFAPTSVGVISGSLVITDDAFGGTAPGYTMQKVNLFGTGTMVTMPGTLTSSNQSPIFGQAVTFTDTFSSAADTLPTGTVTFYSGTTSLGTATLNTSGVATLSTTQLPVGSDAVTAIYAGDTDFNSATSNAITETVAKSPSTGSLTASNNSPNAGQSVTLTQTFSVPNGVAPTGTVTFYSGSTMLGTGTINSTGVATLTTGALPTGMDSVTAVYGGDSNYDAFTSNAITVSVSKNSGTASLSTSNATPSFGQSIVLTDTLATVNGVVPTGTVTFYSGTNVVGAGNVNSAGVALLTTSVLPIGSDTISAVYSGDSNNNTSTSNALTETVSKAAGTGALTTSNASPSFGQAVTFTDTLSSVNGVVSTGTVTFFNGTTAVGTATVNGSGLASFTSSNLPVGNDSITAVYGGDGTYQANTSNASTEAVAKAATTGSVASSTSSTGFGQNVTLTDTLTSTNNVFPTGSVTFYSGSTALGTGAVSSTGVATFTTGSLPVGADSITATYGGDGNFNQSTSNAITVTVAKNTGTAALTTSTSASTFGQAVTLIDTLSSVAGTAPTGTVTFYSGSTVLGTSSVSGTGVASLSTTSLPIGNDTLTAVYAGDSNYNSDTSSSATVSVDKGASTGTLTSSNATPTFGQSVTLSDTLSAINSVIPTGTVTFYNGTVALGTGTVNGSGVAVLNTASLTVGTDAVTAVYGGDTNYTTSTSNALTETVGKSAGTSALTSSTSSPTAGQAVTLTATIPVQNGTVPTGTVTFFNGSTALGTGAVTSSGLATLTTSTLPVGTDTVSASYSGDANYSAGTSNTITETVTKGASMGSLTASSTSPTYGQSVTLSDVLVKVNGLAPTGTVTFYSGSTAIGTGTVDSTGTATLNTLNLPSGSDAITAVYSGDIDYSGSTAGPLTVTVGQSPVTSTLVSSDSGVTSGQYVRLTDTLSFKNGVVPTGTVTFYNGSTVLGTATVSNSGQAIFASNALPVGTDTITAAYPGDTNYASSTSNAVTEIVTKGSGVGTLTTSNPTPTFGRSITFTDTIPTVNGIVPTGSVTFYNGTTTLGTAPLSSTGVATLATASLPVGATSITAQYTGDSTYTMATSNAVAENVTQNNGTGTLVTSSTSTVVGTPVTLTDSLSSVNGVYPTGTVTFYSGATALSPAVAVNGSGVAVFTMSALPSGSDGVTAVYSGDTNYTNNTSNAVTVTVSKSSGTNSLTSSVSSVAYGQPVMLTDSIQLVSGIAPTGTVTFVNGAVVIGTAPVNSNGMATLSTSALPTGTDPITASYSGDTNYAASTSSPATTVTVTKGTSQGTVTASTSTPTAGQSVTLTDSFTTVNGVVPTGSVTFYGGSTNLGSAPVSASGVASLPTAALPVGTDSITAVYSGDATYATSTAGPITVTVGKATTSSTLTTTNATPTAGTAVTFTDAVPVLPGTAPNGSVTFYSGGAVLGTASITSSGVATLATNALAVGTDVVTAVYAGDNNYASSTSNEIAETVSKNSGAGTLTASNAAPAAGQSVSLTYTLSPAAGVAPKGTVTLSSNGTVIGTAPITSAGGATFNTTSLPPGADFITASYSGDSNYNSGSATAITVTVGKSTASGVLTTSNASPSFGQAVTFTDTVPVFNNTAPTGTVTFTAGSTVLGAGNISSSGVATLTTTALPVGTSSVTANYAGDTNYASATSNAVTENVSKDTATDTLTSTATTSVFGQQVTFTDTLPVANGVVPTGTVTFTAGPTVLGTAHVTGSGSATLTTTALPVGMISVSASYAGDTNYSASTSSALSQTVTKAAPTSALATSNATPTYGQTVTFTDTLSASNGKYPTGTVTFYNGSSLLGTAMVNSSGLATLSTTSLALGSDTITASYGGDDNYSAVVSSAISEMVAKSTETGTLMTSNPAPQFGQAVTFTDTLPVVNSLVPSGTVAFYVGTVAMGSGPVNSSGVATLTTTQLPVGSNSVTAAYSGDTNYAAANSNAVGETVSKSPGSGKLNTSNSMPSSGERVTLTDTLSAVNGTLPTGSVTFYEGTAMLGTGGVNASGVATLVTSTFPVSAGTVTAVYGGDTNFNSNTSNAVTESLAKESGGNVLTSSNAAPVAAHPVTFIDTLTTENGVLPTGTVTFLEGNTVLGTATVNSEGIASLTTAALAVGTSTVTAAYSGDANYNTSNSNAVSETVSKNTGTIALNSSTASSAYGQSVALTATITVTAGLSPTGTVTFSLGSLTLGSAPVSPAGIATFNTTALPVGTDAVSALYTGDNNFYTARSNTVTQVVTSPLPSIILSTTPNPQMAGQPVLLSATLQAQGSATLAGAVSFYDGTTLLGTVSVNSSGIASFTDSSLPAGVRNISAVYTDPATRGISTSNIIAQSVVDFTVGSRTPVLSVNPGDTATFDIDLNPLSSLSFAYPVTLTVSGLPASFLASFSPLTVTPGTGGASSSMAIQTYAKQVARAERKQRQFTLGSAAFAFLLMPLLGVSGIRRRIPKGVLMIAIALCTFGAGAVLTGCGGGYFGPAPGSYTLTVTGTSGSLHHSTTVTLNVR